MEVLVLSRLGKAKAKSPVGSDHQHISFSKYLPCYDMVVVVADLSQVQVQVLQHVGGASVDRRASKVNLQIKE